VMERLWRRRGGGPEADRRRTGERRLKMEGRQWRRLQRPRELRRIKRGPVAEAAERSGGVDVGVDGGPPCASSRMELECQLNELGRSTLAATLA
jgi:hypothetical protein